ncbi:MAG TPA: PPOX class F420-dependent oxidoreductase [Chloroflexia bacterium]|nr:PPOX class F420-dependent oxidoreductase [Chloroflexia bacterium]
MTTEEINALLAKPLHAIVATTRRTAPPQLTPVWFYWDGECFYFSTTRDRAKYPNLKRDPAIALIVDDPATHKYVAAYGQAELIEDNVLELTRPILARYMAGERLAQFEASVMNSNRIIVALRPEQIVTN